MSFGTGIFWSGLNYPQSEGYQPYQDTTSDPARLQTAPIPQAKTLKYKTPCEQPKGETESQLCAEWRATIAAEKAADYAFWGTVFTFMGIVGLIVTIVHGQKGLAAARDANRIASESDRPWLEVDNLDVSWGMYSHAASRVYGRIQANFAVRNTGKRPAIEIHYKIAGTNEFGVDVYRLLDALDFIERVGFVVSPDGPAFFGSLIEANTPYEPATADTAQVISLRPFMVAIAIKYRERGSIEWRETECRWMVGGPYGANTSWMESDLPEHPGSDGGELTTTTANFGYRSLT